MTKKTFTSMKQFREYYFPNMVKEELVAPCPFPHKSPEEVPEGMRSCQNLLAVVEAEERSRKKKSRDKELAQISEMRKEYKSMPSLINGERNLAKTGLYHRIEMKMEAFDLDTWKEMIDDRHPKISAFNASLTL